MQARQLDLLTDWTPPEPTVRFADVRVRAAGILALLCRGISAALSDCGKPRAEIARRMSGFLGQTVSKNMLDAYASEARDDHTIGLPRFIALLHATRDRRLLELIAEPLGWAVIERRHVPLIKLAQVHEKTEELRRQADVLRRQARMGGAS